MLIINLTLLIVMAMFLVFAKLMDMVFFTPVTRALDERRAYVKRQHSQADEALAAGAALRADYDARLKGAQRDAQDAIQAALKESEARRAALLEAVKADVSAEVEAARLSIRAERDRAVAGLASEVGSFSEVIQRKVAGSGFALTSAPHGGHE